MKWYSVKKYAPSYYGYYIVRWIDNKGWLSTSTVLQNGNAWIDYEENDGLFKGNITHFAIPDPVEIEE